MEGSGEEPICTGEELLRMLSKLDVLLKEHGDDMSIETLEYIQESLGQVYSVCRTARKWIRAELGDQV